MKKIFLSICILFSLASSAQGIKISVLPASSATSVDSLLFVVVDAGVTKKMYGYQIKNIIYNGVTRDQLAADPPIFIDSLGPHSYKLRIDTTGLTIGGGGSATRYLMSATEPTDTTVGWINITYNFLEAYPVQYRVNGSWSAMDTIAGQFWDNAGQVFSNGRPYKILVGGQSNPGGSYATGGDTASNPHVVCWNDTTHKWVRGHIGESGTPWQWASGENYVMELGRLFAKTYGRSVRIVSEIHGGQPLNKWSGNIHGIPDTAEYFLATQAKVVRSGMIHPDLMIWGHGETGLDSVGVGGISYYDKLVQYYDAIRRFHLIDTTTIIIATGVGDTVFKNSRTVSIGQAEGSLRATQHDKDLYTGYVSSAGVASDWIHFLPPAHHELARRIFEAIPTFPLNPSVTPTGYGDTGVINSISEKRTLIAEGIHYVASTGKPFIVMSNDGPSYTDPYPNGSNQYAEGLTFSAGTNIMRLQHYDGTYLQADGNRWISNKIINAPKFGGNGGGATGTIEPYAANIYFNSSGSAQDMIFGADGLIINSAGSLINSKAQFQVNSVSKGALLPRMTKAQRDAITSPPQGLLIYVTDNGGYLSWYESGWQKITSTAD